MVYDANFINKVLSNDVGLISTFKNTYQELLSTKDALVDEQETYTTLEGKIEDIIKKHDEGAISADEAQQQISSALNLYAPGIATAYQIEKDAIQETIDKKKENADVTKTKSEENVTNTKKANEEIVSSYTELYKSMAEILNKINLVMEEFSENTAIMSSSVSSSISSLISSMNALSSMKDSLSSTIGSIGNTTYTKISDEQEKLIADMGTSLLEAKTNQNLLKVNTVPALTSVTTKNNTSSNTVSFTGDIIVSASGDVNALSKDIVSQLPGAMLQTIYKNTI